MTKQIKALEQRDGHARELEHRYLLRRFWYSAAGFWSKGAPRVSWLLSGAILLSILVNLATSYGMNVWTRVVFDTLQNKDSGMVLLLGLFYLPLLAASVLLAVGQVHARMTMQRRWRAWLNDHLLGRWLVDDKIRTNTVSLIVCQAFLSQNNKASIPKGSRD